MWRAARKSRITKCIVQTFGVRMKLVSATFLGRVRLLHTLIQVDQEPRQLFKHIPKLINIFVFSSFYNSIH